MFVAFLLVAVMAFAGCVVVEPAPEEETAEVTESVTSEEVAEEVLEDDVEDVEDVVEETDEQPETIEINSGDGTRVIEKVEWLELEDGVVYPKGVDTGLIYVDLDGSWYPEGVGLPIEEVAVPVVELEVVNPIPADELIQIKTNVVGQ